MSDGLSAVLTDLFELVFSFICSRRFEVDDTWLKAVVPIHMIDRNITRKQKEKRKDLAVEFQILEKLLMRNL